MDHWELALYKYCMLLLLLLLQVIKLLLLFLSLFIARDRKHHSLSMGSEVDDEEGKSAQGDDLEKMVVPKPTAKDKEADSDSDDDDFDNKSV